MGLFDRIFSRGRSALPGDTAPDSKPDPVFRDADDAPAAPGGLAGNSDFGDFMQELGAVAVSAEESTLAIRDATIAELKQNLEALRPLGDELAETEKARLGLEALVAEQHLELARALEAHHAELTEVRANLEKAERTRERVEERLAKLRAKYKGRDRVASERWHKIRALQQERRELALELKALRHSPVDLLNGSRLARDGSAELISLLDPNRSGGAKAPLGPESDGRDAQPGA